MIKTVILLKISETRRLLQTLEQLLGEIGINSYNSLVFQALLPYEATFHITVLIVEVSE